MKRIEKLALSYSKYFEPRRSPSTVEELQQVYLWRTVVGSFEAGYRQALREAAIRGRLAQLENKVVDIEILALADQEDTDEAGA